MSVIRIDPHQHYEGDSGCTVRLNPFDLAPSVSIVVTIGHGKSRLDVPRLPVGQGLIFDPMGRFGLIDGIGA